MINPLNQLESALGTLFEAHNADQIPIIITKTGLRVDWHLTEQESYSNKTRKRAYWVRITDALQQLEEQQREKVLEKILIEIGPSARIGEQTFQMEKDALLPLLSRAQFDLLPQN
jgi:hypothetical protein